MSEERDELTLEERQMMFDEMMRKKIAAEDQEVVKVYTEDNVDGAPQVIQVVMEVMRQSSVEGQEVMRQVDMASGNNTGMMIRNSFEIMMQNVLFVKNLLLTIAQKERLFEEALNESPGRDPRFRLLNNPAQLDEPEGMSGGGAGEVEGDDNRGSSGGAGGDQGPAV